MAGVLVLANGPLLASEPAVEAILQRATSAFRDIRDYTARLQIHITGENLRMPPSSGILYYKRPDKLKVASDQGQFLLVPRRGIVAGDWVSQLREDADVVLEKAAPLRGRPHYVIRFIPRQAQERLAYARAWLDQERYTLSQLEFVAPDDSWLQVEVWNQQVQGGYWLPGRLEISFRFRSRHIGPPRQNQRWTDLLASAKATLVLRDYRINQGLSDSLFREGATARTGRS